MFSHWLRKSFPKVARRTTARTMRPNVVPLEDRVNPVTLFAVDNANNLIQFDSATPGTIASNAAITGLQAGEQIVGIDVRPATGQLFAMGLVDDGATRTGRIYTIDPATAVATQVGGAPFSTTLADTDFWGFNFNPTVDRIRITNRDGQNLRVNPNNGALAGTDTNLDRLGLNGVSYTQNDGYVATSTLYGLDFDNDVLVTIGGLNGTPSPNGGVVTTVGATGIIAAGAYAVDISSANGTDTTFVAAMQAADSKLYTANLATGQLTFVGDIGGDPLLLGLTAAVDYINVAGTTGNDTVVVTATGADSGSYSLNGGPAVAFSGIKSFAFNGVAGDDTLIVNNPAGGLFAPANGIRFLGGTQSDRLEIQGGAHTTEVHTFLPNDVNGHNGRIALGNGVVTAQYVYAGLEPILVNAGTPNDIVFQMPAGDGDNQTFFEDDGVAGNAISQLRSGNNTFETTRFVAPSNSLRIDFTFGSDTETLTIAGMDSLLATPVFNVIGSNANDTINVLKLNAGVGLTLDLGAGVESINIGNNGLVGSPGLLTPVAGTVNVIGGADGANLTIDGSGAGVAADYAISSTKVTRSLPAGFGGVTYSGITNLLLTVGAGANVVDVNSTAAGTPTTVLTNAGTDTVNVLSTNATGPLTIDTGSELDQVFIGTANVTFAPGKLTPVAGAVTIDGGADFADITVDGSGVGVVADYAITATTVTRSNPAGFGGVTYANANSLFLTVGDGANVIDVTSTAADIPTIVNTNGGADTVNVRSVNVTGALFIDTGSDFDSVNVGTTNTTANPGLLTPIAGPVLVDASADGGALVVDGSGAAVNADYAITASEITRSTPAGFGGVSYLNFHSLLLTVGSGANVIDVVSTAAGTATSVVTNAGNDVIFLYDGVNLNGGTIDGGADTDTIDYSPTTTGVSVNLGLGTSGLTSNLDGIQENPPIASAASGTFNVTYDTITRQATVTGTIDNLTNTITDAHIHRAGVGVNGPVIVGIGAAALVPTGTPGQFTINVVLTIPAAEEAAFLGGQTYFNVHSNAFPGGEIRGQIFSNANLNLPTGTATGTAGIVGIENAIGGFGNDSLVGSFAANLLDGRGGNDTIVGGPGSDTFRGGLGKDVLVWSNGDGSDVMDGEAEIDIVAVNGNLTANDVFVVGANGSRLAFNRTSPGPFSLDIGSTETLVVNGVGGDDSFTVNDTAGVLALTRIDLNGFAGNDSFTVTPAPFAVINVTGHEQTTADAIAFNVTGLTDAKLNNLVATGVTATAGQLTATGAAAVNFRMIESGIPSLSIADATVVEGTGGTTDLVFTVSLAAATDFTVTVDYAVTGGTASDPDDFTALTGTVTFLPGETSQTITVAINPDNVDEDDESFDVTLSNAVNATIADGTAAGTIQDDDLAPAISISDATAVEGTGQTRFTVTLSNPSSFSVSVDYNLVDGTAVAPDDYGVGAGIVSFFPGETTQTITVFVTPDTLDEDDESFDVTLSNAFNATILDGDAIGTIVDDDLPPVVSISDATVTEGGTGFRAMTFVVSLDAPSGRTVTVDYATGSASATAGSDFEAQAGTLTFAPGVTTQTIVVNAIGDVVVELDEAFGVELFNSVNATLLDLVGTGTIVNDDSAGVEIATGGASVEGSDRAFTILLTSAVDVPVTVDFSTINGTAIGGATGDFLALANQTVTFAPGETVQTVIVTVNDDRRLESDESFVGSIGTPNAAGRAVTLTVASATAVVTDNESAVVAFGAAPNVFLTAGNVLESNDLSNIPVTLTLTTVGSVGTPGLDRAVVASVTRTGGTATVDVDFTFTSPTTVTFAAGSNGTSWTDNTTVNVATLEDLRTEPSETIAFALATTTAATTVSAPGTYTQTILDDDAMPASIRTATAGPGTNGTAVRTFTEGKAATSFVPFFGFTGAVTVAQGDVNADGIPDLVVGAGPGGGPHVKVFDGVTGTELRSFFVFGSSFAGGVSVAIGDVDGDGAGDLIVGAGPGGGPHVKAFSGVNGSEIRSFFAYAPTFTGGVNVAAGDLTGDRFAEIITGAGAGGGPHVKAFDGKSGAEVRSFFAFAGSFAGGVNVAAGDLNGDGLADIVVGAGPGGGPHVRAFNGATATSFLDFFAYDAAFAGGVDVGVVDQNADGVGEIVTGAGPGGAPHVKRFGGKAPLTQLSNFFADEIFFNGGVNVG